jgi:hypothetical protein
MPSSTLFFAVPTIESRALHLLGKFSNT